MRVREMRQPEAHAPPDEERASHLRTQMRLAGTRKTMTSLDNHETVKIAARTGGVKGEF